MIKILRPCQYTPPPCNLPALEGQAIVAARSRLMMKNQWFNANSVQYLPFFHPIAAAKAGRRPDG
jgi:hypothetical protein